MDHIEERSGSRRPSSTSGRSCATRRAGTTGCRAREFSDFSGPYDQVGTTYVSKMKMMGFEMKGTSTVVEVEPLKLIHEHTDDQGPQDTFFRFEPEGDATRVIVESDYEMPGHIPGFLKSLMTKSFFERQTRHMLGDFKALAEATVPVPA